MCCSPKSWDYVEIDTLTWERKLVDVVDAEFKFEGVAFEIVGCEFYFHELICAQREFLL